MLFYKVMSKWNFLKSMLSGAPDKSVLRVHAGIVIVGEDTVGHFDLGIFVASIVPNGPADRDGRIRPGRE